MSRYKFDNSIRRDHEQRYTKKHARSLGEASPPPRPPPVDYNVEFRDRSHSNGHYEKEEKPEKVDRENVENIEKRRRYVASLLERYYAHPSNRYHSMPSSLRKQLVDTLAVSNNENRRIRDDDLTNGGTGIDDSYSDISSYAVRSARATPDPSFYDDEDDVHSSTFNGFDNRKKKHKSKFFRSSSIRSLKNLMKKLGGGGSNSRPRSRSSTDPGLFASGQDSGLETPSDTSINYNTTNLQVRSRSPIHENGHRPQKMNGHIEIPTPALCGIVNHGNTCYINAVIQCLSNTDLLAEYFLSERYLADLNNNLRNADRYGTQGHVTQALAEFMQALWFNNYKPDISLRFKALIDHCSEQYRGNQQQDAQEFFYWLTDRVHEDLNVAVKRRYKLYKTPSKSEDELAMVAMEKHLEAHNSFISARFHGLFLSSVTCPMCGKQSTKSDPFMCISLPVPQCTKRPLFVVIVYLNRQPRQVRFGLNADVTATFREVKKCLADATDLNPDNLVLCAIDDRGFQSSLADENEVIALGSVKCIWALETPSVYSSNRDEELILLVGNQSSVSKHRFGSFVTLKVHREVSYGDLCRSILLALRPQFRTNTSIQDIPLSVFSIRIVDDYRPLVYVPQDVALPLYTQAVDNALTGTSVLHLKVMLEWQRNAKATYFASTDDRIVDHVSAQDLCHQEARPEIQSLRDCLSEYTRLESCQWYCADCRRRQDNATKRIVLYWLPDILVLHLKRFKQQSNGQLVKLDATVWFPVNELDLSEFTYQSIYRNQNKPVKNARSSSGNSYRAQNGELYLDSRQHQNLYDLYAVCNHSGYSPHSGHYTAYCRNPVNGRWYCYDDQSVTAIRERDIVTNAAYLLFYERRHVKRNNSGQHSSTESGFVDHWYFRLWSRNERNSRSSKEIDRIENDSPTDSQAKLPGVLVKTSGTEAISSSLVTSTPTSLADNKLFVKLPGMEEAKKLKHFNDAKHNISALGAQKREIELSNATDKRRTSGLEELKKTVQFSKHLESQKKQNGPVESSKPLQAAAGRTEPPITEDLVILDDVKRLDHAKQSNGNQMNDGFTGFDIIALPSCSKILTTGIAAPILPSTNGSPSLSSMNMSGDRLALRRVRTCSVVETDL